MRRVKHKAGNYPLGDVYTYIHIYVCVYIFIIAESNLYSGFPIMQFISLETGLEWRNNGSSSKFLRCSLSYSFSFPFSSASTSLLHHLFRLRRVFPPSTVSPHSFSPLHLYGFATTIYQLPPNLLTYFIPLFLWRFIL